MARRSTALLGLMGLALLCTSGPIEAGRCPEKGKSKDRHAFLGVKQAPPAAVQRRKPLAPPIVVKGGSGGSGRWPQIGAELMP